MPGTEVGSLYYDLSIDDKRLKSQLASADKSVESFGSRVSQHWDKSVAASQQFAAALAGVTAATVAFGVKSYQAFKESETVMAQTEAVLKSTGRAAGVTTDEITKLAKELQRTSKFTDEQVQSGENLLLTFTKIGKKTFPEATRVMVDMSAALGQDLKSSAIQLGKALNDPIQGVTALRRVGVSFNEQQLEQIETLQKSGKLFEAQSLILKELGTEFGGSAKAASDAAGPMEKIKDVMGETQEVIGKLISKAIDPFIERLGKWVEKIDEGDIEKFVDNVLGWLKTNGDTLAGIIGGALAPAVLSLATSFFMLALRLAPFIALGVLIANFDELLQRFRDLAPPLQALIILLTTFYTILGGVFLVNLAKAAGATLLFSGTIGTVTGVFKALIATIQLPIVMPALVIAAALASIYQVVKAYDAVRGAIEETRKAQEAVVSAGNSQQAVINQLKQLIKTGTPEQKARAQASLKRFSDTGSFASGVTNFEGGLAYVHQGELLVNMPKGTDVIPKKDVEKMGGDSRTIINIGTIQDRSDADYIFRRMDRNQERVMTGLSPA